MYKNDLIRKIRLISKFMTPRPGKKAITIQILPNISRSKVNQRMVPGQLKECSTINTFVEKSNTKCGGQTIPRPFPKKPKLIIFLDQWS